VVLPASTTVPPLNGGIALKRNQTLIGAGPAVPGARLRAEPRIENTQRTHHHGDAIELADGARVENLVVGPAYRGGIYGINVTNVLVHGNDVSATNSSCTTGFVVQPFVLPTMAPGVGAPFSSGLANGWAAIMIDASHATERALITGNYVHDSACADGIDVRASGRAQMAVRVLHNRVTRLREGQSQQSVLAIGMQTTGRSSLTAIVDGNTETYIGNAIYDGQGDADSEGLFANAAGHSVLAERASRNTFAHGLGHLSANCFEAAASNGGPTMHIGLSHSSCQDVVGDILEADNLSRDATLTFRVEHVVAEHSTFSGAEAFHQVEPGDDGDCMLEVASGAASTTSVQIEHSRLAHCVADGLGVVSNVVDGSGPVSRLGFNIENSQLIDNQQSNLRVANVTPVITLDGRIAGSDLARSEGNAVILEDLDTTGGTHARLDFGGGSLGSAGRNCIYGGRPLTAEVVGYSASARDDWWGQPGGPSPGQVEAVRGRLDTAHPLARPPAPTC